MLFFFYLWKLIGSIQKVSEKQGNLKRKQRSFVNITRDITN